MPILNNLNNIQEENTSNFTIEIEYPEINERELVKHLMKDYYQFTRPVKNYSSMLTVTIMPQIYNLVEVVMLKKRSGKYR